LRPFSQVDVFIPVQLRGKPGLRAEAEAVAADADDRAEARAVLADMEPLRAW